MSRTLNNRSENPRSSDRTLKALVIGVEPRSLLNFRKSLLIQLIQQGYEVTGVALPMDQKQHEEILALGAKFQAAYFSRGSMNPLRDIKTFISLLKIYSRAKPDLVIAYTVKPVVYGALAAWFMRVPRFAAMITGLGYSFIDGPEPKRKVARFVTTYLYALAFKCSNAVIFQNPDDRDYFSDLGLLSKCESVGVVNGSGVDLEQFDATPLPRNTVFLMIARLLADKGIREYVAAAKALRAKYGDAKTILVGGLDQSPNSVTQSELDGWISEGLDYRGQVMDVRPIISQASIVVLPSYREGTPRSVLEGMAMGRAIITTDAPGCRETVIEGENGLLVKPRDVAALYNAMEKLHVDPKLIKAMGQRSRQIAVEKYDAVAVANDVIRWSNAT